MSKKNVKLREVALLAPWVDRNGDAFDADGKSLPPGQLYVVGRRLCISESVAKQLEASKRAVWAPSPIRKAKAEAPAKDATPAKKKASKKKASKK